MSLDQSVVPAGALLRAPPARARLAALAGPAAVGVALLLALALRLTPALLGPMWLDETWTGMIASQRHLGDAVRQIRDDANAPLYYLVMWAWAKIAGVSNVALRIPNILFGLGAAGLAMTQRRALGGRAAAVWGVLLALWWPGINFGEAARCYPLLVLASTALTAAHVRLLQQPSLGRAAAWAIAGALAILTHYYAAPLVAAQGVTLLLVHRGGLWRLWPAALAFAPVLAWGLYHLPRLLAFAQPQVAWYPIVGPSDGLGALVFLCDSPLTLGVILVLAGVVATRLTRAARDGREQIGRKIGWTVAASLATAVLFLVLGTMRPSFTLRYLTPLAPGALLGLAWLGEQAAARLPAAVLALPLAFGVSALRAPHPPAPFGFETASAYLAQAHPTRLAFFWDHPATQVEAPEQLRQVGGFFLARAGLNVPVDPVMPAPGTDPIPLMTQAGGNLALLWVYDLDRRGVAAQRYPPALLLHDARWGCRNFGDARQGVIACTPR